MSIQDLMVLRGRAASNVALHRPDDPDGRSFGRFRMAVPRARRRDDGEWEESEPDWYTVKAWGALAEHLSLSVRRGLPVLVVGRPVAQSWINRNGEAQADLAIHAVSVGLDLVFGVCTFSRLRRQTVEDEEERGEAEPSAQTGEPESPYGTDYSSDDEDEELMEDGEVAAQAAA